jgi:ABC-type dipeptide/oligopeptide/nickel transport system ATPase component
MTGAAAAPARDGAAPPLLVVDGLRIEFPTRRGTLTAVHDISFSILPGEVLGVIGESGAGKSLTGSAVIGLIDPPGRIAGGEIRLAGRRIDNLPDEAMRKVRGREIGAVFQDPLTSLNPLFTVGRQLVETITTHLPVSTAEARRRAVALLDEVGIPAAARRVDHYPHQFSGGMRQRVVIALALAANPRLIIADEPPPGCTFHPRCPHADARCRREAPALLPFAGGGEVACHAVAEARLAAPTVDVRLAAASGSPTVPDPL